MGIKLNILQISFNKNRIGVIFSNPLFIFWAYYFIGPFFGYEHVFFINEREGLFSEDVISVIYLKHLVTYLMILPLVLKLSSFDYSIDSYGKSKVRMDNLLFMIPIILVILYLFSQVLSLSNNFILLDSIKADIYGEWLEKNHIITLAIISLIISRLFLSNKFGVLLAVPMVMIDVIMGRRHLMSLFFFPFLAKLTKYQIALFVLVMGLISSIRHGLDHIALDVSSFLNMLFAESYMVMLSSSSHGIAEVGPFDLEYLIHFERLTDYCRIVQFAAGGFSARMQYNYLFGIISITVYSILFYILHCIAKKYIIRKLHPIYAIIVFYALFILYRDDMGNSLIFLTKYIFFQIAMSFLYLGLTTRLHLNKGIERNNSQDFSQVLYQPDLSSF